MSRRSKRLKQLKEVEHLLGLKAEVSMRDLKIVNLKQQVANLEQQVNNLEQKFKELDDIVPWRIRAEERFDFHRTIRFIGEFNLDLITRGVMNKGDRYSPYGRIDYRSLAPLLDSMARQMFQEVVKEINNGFGSITTKMG